MLIPKWRSVCLLLVVAFCSIAASQRIRESDHSVHSIGNPTGWNYRYLSDDFVSIPSMSPTTYKEYLASNTTFISEELESLLDSIPPDVWDGFAVVGVIMGVLLAFFGLRMLAVSSFVCGAIVGIFAGAFVLSQIALEVNGEVWLIIVGVCGLICGLFVACMLKLARLVVGIAIGLMIAGVIIQYGVADIIGNNIAVWVILGILIVIFTVVTYRAFEYGLIIASSVAGGCFVTLGLSHFFGGDISIILIYADPSTVVCHVDECWIVLGVGAAVCIIGGLVQFRRARSKKGMDRSYNGPSDKDLQQRRKDDNAMINSRLNQIQHENSVRMSQVSAGAHQAVQFQQQEISKLQDAVLLVEKERKLKEEESKKEKKRIQKLEKELRSTKSTLSRIAKGKKGINLDDSSIEERINAEQIKELERKIEVLRRVQDVNDKDKEDLGNRNAELERQLLATQQLANDAIANVAYAEERAYMKAEKSILQELETERAALQIALREATENQQTAKDQSNRALAQVEKLQSQIESGGVMGADTVALVEELKQLRAKQERFEKDYQELKDVNSELVVELGRVAAKKAAAVSDTNEQQQAKTEDYSAKHESGASIAISVDENQAEPMNLQQARPVAASVFDEEVEEIMEDQIDFKQLARDLGAGVKELFLAFVQLLIIIFTYIAMGLKYIATSIRDKYRERKMEQPSNKDLKAEEWVESFKGIQK